MLMRSTGVVSVALTLVSVLSGQACAAQDQGVARDAQQAIDRALEYLKTQRQPDGTWQRSPRAPVAISALVLRAFVAEPKYAKAEFVTQGFDKLLAHQHDDGSIHSGMLANYNTAVAVSALAAARNPRYQPAIDKAVAYLKRVQWSDTIAGRAC